MGQNDLHSLIFRAILNIWETKLCLFIYNFDAPSGAQPQSLRVVIFMHVWRIYIWQLEYYMKDA